MQCDLRKFLFCLVFMGRGENESWILIGTVSINDFGYKKNLDGKSGASRFFDFKFPEKRLWSGNSISNTRTA